MRRLAYLGRLVADKGIADAVEAVGLLLKSPGFEDVTLRIAGTGEATAELERQIAGLGVSGAVTLVGPLRGDAKVEFLRSADLFVLPTRFSEGLPYTILESLAAGTPIVTTGMGGIADVVTDGEHGAFVRPREPRDIADAVRRLAGDPERVRRMSRACAARAEEHYGLARFARAFGALYESLGAGGAVAASFAPE